MENVFAFEKPIWEILVRGSVAYVAIVVLLRVIPKRHLGTLSPNDFIALVIIGGLVTNAISGESPSMLDLLLMALVVIFWSYVLDLLEYKFPGWRRITRETPTLIVHGGQLLKANMRKERLTEDELAASLREQGIEDVSSVKQAVLEIDGRLSVVRYEPD